MEHQTPAFGKIYTVTSPAGCTVTDAATLKLLQTCPAGVQTPFVACGPSVIISDDSALFAGPFDLARVPLGSSGGAGAPLTPDQLTAVENAVGGKLENVTIVAREATKATGWISSTAWSEIEVGGELFQINGTPFYSHGSTTTETLATAINETLAGLVIATADDANKISLESHNAGEHANTITLSTSNPNVYLSGETLEGGQDEVKPSASLLVDNKGVHFSNVPDDAILYTGGMKIATQGGDIYHDDGSATFAGSYNGHTYAAVIDFKHFEVRRDGELIVHFHESNGEPVLELGGARVQTTRFDYDSLAEDVALRMAGITYYTGGAAGYTIFNNSFLSAHDFSSLSSVKSARFGAYSQGDDGIASFLNINHQFGANVEELEVYYFEPNNSFTTNAAASRLGTQRRVRNCPSSVRVVFTPSLSAETSQVLVFGCMLASTGNECRRLSIIAPKVTRALGVFNDYSSGAPRSIHGGDVDYFELNLPALTSSTTIGDALHVAGSRDTQKCNVADAKISLPSLATDCTICQYANLSKTAVLYLLSNINKNVSGLSLTIGMTEDVYNDADVQASIASLEGKWSVNYI